MEEAFEEGQGPLRAVEPMMMMIASLEMTVFSYKSNTSVHENANKTKIKIHICPNTVSSV
jgi:hypothetical protein